MAVNLSELIYQLGLYLTANHTAKGADHLAIFLLKYGNEPNNVVAQMIFCTGNACAALTPQGKVITWGNHWYGGRTPDIPDDVKMTSHFLLPSLLCELQSSF